MQNQVWDQLVRKYPDNVFYAISWQCDINTEKLQAVVHTKTVFDKYEQEWKKSDHAKLAIVKEGKAIVCVSDLNLAVTQADRPGGLLCHENEGWQTAFSQTFTYTTKEEKEKKDAEENEKEDVEEKEKNKTKTKSLK
uniref:Uncharacterized protein n=1 Tax=Panagrolaimus davidi TaxID=227884 RepID=A0A914PWI9_9BILA